MAFNSSYIRSIARENLKAKFENELQYQEDNEYTKNNERINNLKLIIDSFNKVNNTDDNHKEIMEFVKKSQYYKEWHKIINFHKKELLEEYVQSKNIDEDQKEKLKNFLFSLLEKGYLKTKKNVDYNLNNGKINEIMGVVYTKGKYVLKTQKTSKE